MATDAPRTQEPPVKPEAPAPDFKGVPSVTAKNLSHQRADFMGIIPETMKPNLHYRWVRSRQDESHVAVYRARRAGYDFVKIGEVQLLAEPDDRGDKKIYIGDCVLMACPKKLHNERQAAKRQQREGILASTTAVTEQKAREIGVKLIKDED